MIRQTIENYKKIESNVEEIINISGYRNNFIAQKMGMNVSTFNVKKQRCKFTSVEIGKMLDIIYNDELENYFLGMYMEILEDDEVMSEDEFNKFVDENRV